MKAMIFAAGLGTRLKPLTDHLPKALVPVAGKPMLEHVILKLKAAGFTEIVINIHHFGEQIIGFLQANQHFGLTIHISDEREQLLDTGGGIQKASTFFQGNEPFLVHNVDILSDTDLKTLYDYHVQSGNDATLLASQRKTSRYLLFDDTDRLCLTTPTASTDGSTKIPGKPNRKASSTIPNATEPMPSAESMSSPLHSSLISRDGAGNSPSWTSTCRTVRKPVSAVA